MTKPAEAANLTHLGAVALRDLMVRGERSSEAVAQAHLDRIAFREAEVQAWTYLDPAMVLAQARACDARLADGQVPGPLHGLPIGLKDIIDTADMPTENGAVQDRDRRPDRDAVLVTRLKAAGAIVMGKTVTAELASMHPGKTRNPVNVAHTPGGSSSGSAAAVADGMVPLAIGTQTGGSVIRPAAFCGTVGYKPSFGVIPRAGVLEQSPSLDTVGVFARSVDDAALLASVLCDNWADVAGAGSTPPVFAFVRPPLYDSAESEMRAALEALVVSLGDQCHEARLPAIFDLAAQTRETINFFEMVQHFARYAGDGWAMLSPVIQGLITRGRTISPGQYAAARTYARQLQGGLDDIFARCDAIITLAAPGPAPKGLGFTGDPIFNGLWTLCGVPTVSLPLLTSSAGLPMGVQLVGPRGGDAGLLCAAKWLEHG